VKPGIQAALPDMRSIERGIGLPVGRVLDKTHLACGWQPQIMRGPAARLKPA